MATVAPDRDGAFTGSLNEVLEGEGPPYTCASGGHISQTGINLWHSGHRRQRRAEAPIRAPFRNRYYRCVRASSTVPAAKSHT